MHLAVASKDLQHSIYKSWVACILRSENLPCACLIGARSTLAPVSPWRREPFITAAASFSFPPSISCSPAASSSNACAA